MTNKIEVKNLKKTYDNFVLGKNSFEIKKGFITGFIGKNGMGKTTTIKSLLSLINYEGEVFVDGEDARNLNYLQDVGIIMDDSFLSKDWKISLVNEAMKCGYENLRNGEEIFYYLSYPNTGRYNIKFDRDYGSLGTRVQDLIPRN